MYSQLYISGINMYKDINIFYNKVDFITDYGYVFEESIKQESYNLQETTIDTI
jgi:hypothetical protein